MLAAPPIRLYLAIEYGVLFFGLVVLYTLLFQGTSPIPVLLVLGAAVVVYLLRSPTFDRSSLWRPDALPGQLRSIGLLWGVTAVGAGVAVAVARPDLLLSLPREDPLTWALVMVLYPLASVYPQELIFRAFLFQRYAPVFGEGHGMVGASAAAFGFVHLPFGNWIAIVLSLAGGWIFASRYQRTRSLLTVSFEHALYGMLIFTIGLGLYFFHGAVRG
ncbi:CPBP family intramembrane glutamic endopeptidase [Amycolatopsis cihanbeyliensis]|uniref:CAAX prenyl protease-like protein n=1 Tax=Amycolatopsis cihanbeyliensis TaxID=1128664 RepID=A0A542DRY2_AMYCI|nr:CPBP family intramembrane glutamic endopeptidase [Amycolatopsis cihanbeyliensis]TQJ05849.1 CAAX prenyl protease-like protein [Amycolatopsis cihanbeyliensis]